MMHYAKSIIAFIGTQVAAFAPMLLPDAHAVSWEHIVTHVLFGLATAYLVYEVPNKPKV